MKCHCGETINPYRRAGYHLSACDPCLEAGCTEQECYRAEELGDPLPRLMHLSTDGILVVNEDALLSRVAG